MATLTLTSQERGTDKPTELTGDLEVFKSADGSLSVYDRMAKGQMSSGLVFAAPPGMWRDSSITPRTRTTIVKG